MTRFATKSDWARAQAEEFDRRARELERESSGGSYARAARKGEQVSRLRAEAARYRQIAAKFAQRRL